MGIKRKILLGFISIGALLFLSGIISTLELVNYKSSTRELLEHNHINIELSKGMLDAIQEQNTALLMNVTDSVYTKYNYIIAENKQKFDSIFNEARELFPESESLAEISHSYDAYSEVISGISDTTTVKWFMDIYKTPYFNLTNSIKDFMSNAEQQIIEHTADLERKAYRATMVGIIALASGLLLIILFYYMITIYVLSPIISMQKSLSRYLESRIPFDVTVSTEDEIETLRDDIKRLIEKTKK